MIRRFCPSPNITAPLFLFVVLLAAAGTFFISVEQTNARVPSTIVLALPNKYLFYEEQTCGVVFWPRTEMGKAICMSWGIFPILPDANMTMVARLDKNGKAHSVFDSMQEEYATEALRRVYVSLWVAALSGTLLFVLFMIDVKVKVYTAAQRGNEEIV